MSEQEVLQPALLKVKREFLAYRKKRRNGHEKIPEKLWEMAAELMEQFSLNQVAKVLGVDCYSNRLNTYSSKG